MKLVDKSCQMQDQIASKPQQMFQNIVMNRSALTHKALYCATLMTPMIFVCIASLGWTIGQSVADHIAWNNLGIITN